MISLEELISLYHFGPLFVRQPSIFFKPPEGRLAMQVEGGEANGQHLEWIRLSIPKGRFGAPHSVPAYVCRIKFEQGHAPIILCDGVICFGLARNDGSDGVTLENLNDVLLSVKKVEIGKQTVEGIGLEGVGPSDTMVLPPGCWELSLEMKDSGRRANAFLQMYIGAQRGWFDACLSWFKGKAASHLGT
jgi:hypothetical protein